jgi:hypothetical protein
MNAFAGGTSGACGRFELDYWGAAATEALRRLEHRLDGTEALAPNPPRILICVPFRDQMAGPMLRRNWQLAHDVKQADFVIETERSRCAKENAELILIDEIVRDQCPFSWTYVKRNSAFATAAHPSSFVPVIAQVYRVRLDGSGGHGVMVPARAPGRGCRCASMRSLSPCRAFARRP